jgi:hypothetical protein
VVLKKITYDNLNRLRTYTVEQKALVIANPSKRGVRDILGDDKKRRSQDSFLWYEKICYNPQNKK